MKMNFILITLKSFLLFILIIWISDISAQNYNIKYIKESAVADTVKNGAMLYQVSPELSYIYGKPKIYQSLINTPLDLYAYTKQKYSVASITAMTLVTAALVVWDQEIIDASKRFGTYIHLDGTNNQKNISPINGVPIYVPTDLPSGLYYIGDGFTEMAVNAGFYIFGYVRKDNRALQTATQLTEGLFAMGFTTQLIKHITGRQCPFTATKPGGKWEWFPNQFEYQKAVPHYDAFPSGHLATAMMTVTVISSNYPEYKFIKPLGYSLMALCGYQMMNNGVHWMSDYPLALAIGYTFGKIAVARGRLEVVKNNQSMGLHHKNVWDNLHFAPTLSGETIGFGMVYKL